MLIPILGRLPGQPTMHDLDEVEKIIGRQPESSIHAPSESVSRQHARIFFANNAWHVEDMGSRNGITVNGRPVATAQLSDADVIQVGDVFYALSFATEADLPRMTDWIQFVDQRARKIANANPSTAYLAEQPAIWDMDLEPAPEPDPEEDQHETRRHPTPQPEPTAPDPAPKPLPSADPFNMETHRIPMPKDQPPPSVKLNVPPPKLSAIDFAKQKRTTGSGFAPKLPSAGPASGQPLNPAARAPAGTGISSGQTTPASLQVIKTGPSPLVITLAVVAAVATIVAIILTVMFLQRG